MEEDWTRLHTIGHGATASVSLAVSKKSGEFFAIKSAELSQSEPLRREHEILSTIDDDDCDFVVRNRGFRINEENGKTIFNLFLEYAPGGTVADVVRKCGSLDEAKVRCYTCQIVKGMEFLHGRGIVHCDVKTSNVLVFGEGVRVADFGCAKAVGQPEIGGTPMYMAPEVVRGEEQGFAADVWALGCAVIEMSSGRPPWPDAAVTVRRIAFSGEVPEFPDCLSELGKDFLRKCLRIDPMERWTAKELLRHPFLNGFPVPIESPTSVLERGVWGRVGEESSMREDIFSSQDSLECPKQRMKELGVESEESNWEWIKDWITVRDSKNVNISGKIR